MPFPAAAALDRAFVEVGLRVAGLHHVIPDDAGVDELLIKS
jgi:hypothetical protein